MPLFRSCHLPLLVPPLRAAALLVACLLFTATAGAAETRHSGNGSKGDIVVAAVRGQVTATMAGASAPLYSGAILQLPATIRTAEDGAVELRQGNTTIAAAANTELEIPQSAAAEGLIERVVQISGNAFYNVGKRERSKLRVETPHLVAVIKGTQFNVASQEDSTTIALFEGRLEVRAADDSDVIELNAGEIAIRHHNEVTISVLRMAAVAPGDSHRNNPAVSNSAASDAVASSAGATMPVPLTAVVDVGSPGATTQTEPELRGPSSPIDAASAELSADAGAMPIDANASLSGAGVDVGASTVADLGTASIDVGASAVVDAGVDLAGSVDAGASAGIDLGAASVDVGASAGIDVGAAVVDAGASAGIDLGGASVDASASIDIGGVGAQVDVGTTVDVTAGGLVADVGASVDTGSAAVDVGLGASVVDAAVVDTGAAVDLGGGTTAGVDLDVSVDPGAGASVDVDVGVSAAPGVSIDAGVDAGGGNAGVDVELGNIVDVELDVGSNTIDVDVGDTDNETVVDTETDTNLLDDLSDLLNRRQR